MKFEEIPEFLKHEYSQECPCCLMTTIILTQHGIGEYQTEVFIRCPCGEFLEFSLPVN